MTVETQTFKTQATGNSSATDFSFNPMAIFKTTDIVVTLTNLTDGSETTLTEGTGPSSYSVTASSGSYPSNTGVSGFITYPEDEVSPISSSFQITIKRVLTLEQTVDLENQGGYFPDTQEAALDKLVMIALQQQEELDRVLKAAVSDPAADLTLPTVTTRANKFLTFDASGNASVSSSTVGVPVSDFILTIVDDESAAEVLTTLGVTSYIQTLLDDADAATARATLGISDGQQTYDATLRVQVFS